MCRQWWAVVQTLTFSWKFHCLVPPSLLGAAQVMSRHLCCGFTSGIHRHPSRVHGNIWHMFLSEGMIMVPFGVFYMAVNCEWAQLGTCVGVVEDPAGPGLSTEKLFALRLSIPELRSAHNPLIFTSDFPWSGGRLQGGRRGSGPPEFMIRI